MTATYSLIVNKMIALVEVEGWRDPSRASACLPCLTGTSNEICFMLHGSLQINNGDTLNLACLFDNERNDLVEKSSHESKLGVLY